MLRAEKISKIFKHQTVIKELSFSLEQGEKISLMAPSGAGKTTLIGILAGIDHDYSGIVTDHARLKGVVFQDPGLFWYKTVQENIVYSLKIRKIPWDRQTKNSFDSWMAVTKLKGFENCYPHEISQGMKHKTAIVRTFLCNPDLVLLDEPFSSIDQESVCLIVDHINAWYPNITIVVASHSLDQANAFSDRIFIVTKMPISEFEIRKPLA